MKTRDEIIDALELRIKSLNMVVHALHKNNLFRASHVTEQVKEELETLLKWIRD